MQKTCIAYLFSVMRLIKRGKSFGKKLPNNFINYYRWMTITNKDVLNFNKLIMKADARRADSKGLKEKNTN